MGDSAISGMCVRRGVITADWLVSMGTVCADVEMYAGYGRGRRRVDGIIGHCGDVYECRVFAKPSTGTVDTGRGPNWLLQRRPAHAESVTGMCMCRCALIGTDDARGYSCHSALWLSRGCLCRNTYRCQVGMQCRYSVTATNQLRRFAPVIHGLSYPLSRDDGLVVCLNDTYRPLRPCTSAQLMALR